MVGGDGGGRGGCWDDQGSGRRGHGEDERRQPRATGPPGLQAAPQAGAGLLNQRLFVGRVMTPVGVPSSPGEHTGPLCIFLVGWSWEAGFPRDNSESIKRPTVRFWRGKGATSLDNNRKVVWASRAALVAFSVKRKSISRGPCAGDGSKLSQAVMKGLA